MSAIALVIAIALPIAMILAGLVYYGRHQQRQQSKRMQTRLILAKVEELKEALEFLLIIDDFKEIPRVIFERVEQLVDMAHKTWPGNASEEETNPVEEFDLEALRLKLDEENEPRKILKSDREINYAKKQVGRVLHSLGNLAKRKMITPTNLNDYRRHLRLVLLEREVDTFVAQGDIAADRSDVMTAGNYYKAARKLLIEFDLQYPEKNDKIRMLSERTTSLFNGGRAVEDNLSKALNREAEHQKDPHGIPNGDEDEKRKY